MLLATLFCMGDPSAVLASSTPFPFMPIFQTAVRSTPGAVAMSAIVVAMLVIASTGCLASTSRVYWALARDCALPGWHALARTSPCTKVPRNAVLVAAVVAAVLALVNAGDPAAFTGVVSVSVAGLLASYLAATGLLLWRRLRPGYIRCRRRGGDEGEEGEEGGGGRGRLGVMKTVGSHLTWGPWRIPGALGVTNNVFTGCFILFVLFFSFWPMAREVTPQNTNWAALITVVVLVFSVLYYFIWARHEFHGPRIEV
jgi:choline transport protein